MDYEEEVTTLGLIILFLFELIIISIGMWYNTI